MSNDLPKNFGDAASSVSGTTMSEVFDLKEYFFKKHVTIFCSSSELIAKKRFRCIICALFSSYLNFFEQIYSTMNKKCNSKAFKF